MPIFEPQLKQLQAKVARLRKIQHSLESLYHQQQMLQDETHQLAMQLQKEQGDVDRLERQSLASIFASILGNRERQLEKERMEAHAAALKHSAAVQQLENVNRDIFQLETEKGTLLGAQAAYEKLVAETLAKLKNSGNSQRHEIYRLEERLSFLEQQLQELHEALNAGDAALQQTYRIEDALSSAKNWGMYDMLGGGFIATAVKHSHLDGAQKETEHLQHLLSRFRIELADIHLNVDIQIQLDGFLQFADYFFDGILADWAVQSRMEKAHNQVSNTQYQISNILGRLDNMTVQTRQEMQSLRDQLDRIAESAAT